MLTITAAPLAHTMLPELAHELALTRRVLERAPEAQFGWQPHPKSMTLGQLASHTTDLPGWIEDTFNTEELDVAYFDDDAPTTASTRAELLERLEAKGAAAHAALEAADDEAFAHTWTMRRGEQIIIRQTRAEIARHLISHMIHHRAQLMVYLRLLDVPVPGVYGPSADETNGWE